MEIFIAVLVLITSDGIHVNRTFLMETNSIAECAENLAAISYGQMIESNGIYTSSAYECQSLNNTFMFSPKEELSETF